VARLQILELPEGTGDDRPPFVLVIDEVAEEESERVIDSREAMDGMAKKMGARAVAVFHGMTVTIPANESVSPPPADAAERVGEAEIMQAHERSRLALCDALLLSRDTTWRQLVEQAAERQRTMARLFRQLDRVRELPEYPDLMDSRQEHPAVWKHGYQCGVLAAKTAARNERATAEGGG
jgi:hypothetical protein